MKILAHTTDNNETTQFIIACDPEDVSIAAGALLFLPTNYTVTLPAGDWRAKLGLLASEHTIMQRVQMRETEAAPTPPFFVVFDSAEQPIESAEAFASTILAATRGIE